MKDSFLNEYKTVRGVEKAVKLKVLLSATSDRIPPMIDFLRLHTPGYRFPEETCIKKYKRFRALSGVIPDNFERPTGMLNLDFVYGYPIRTFDSLMGHGEHAGLRGYPPRRFWESGRACLQGRRD
jgi:hypothetical protein